ncbi:conserved unknown protein [Ectocarpus siliculosus]|uniref:Uncharacterized protein n=1 Tax=Ectocarpus siliculosus TaxID=2880 RepID=D7FN87_ECTSI|nr:conserved unknown protein [Ectocarpus siliculosus]|eukprot:CBJ30144.1 conserved unknown protein [Ectocarpus siliculosus]
MASLAAIAEKPGGGEGGQGGEQQTRQQQQQQQQQQRRRRRLCVCTRVHQNNADRPVDLVKVREFLNTALLYADSIAIAVGPPPPPPPPSTDQHGTTTTSTAAAAGSSPPLLQSITLAAREAEREAPPDRAVESVGEGGGGEGRAAGVVNVFEVTPWGKFTPALNALLGFASRDGAELVMFQSLETTVGKDAVSGMEAYMGPADLVVGAALTGHAFRGGETVELTGVTTPWNTLALWDVAKLAKLGFLGVAEGLLPGVPAGVEEVTAIAALQVLLGAEHARAKLVRLPQVRWHTAWEDEGRRRWHESKMSSKRERADKQMSALGIKKGTVEHLG